MNATSAEATFYEEFAARLRELGISVQVCDTDSRAAHRAVDGLEAWIEATSIAEDWWFPHEYYHFIADIDLCSRDSVFARHQAVLIEATARDLDARAAALRRMTWTRTR